MANKSFENAIKSYLDNRAKTDSLFAETYKKANKTLKGCCAYIISQARSIGGNAVAVKDETVFGWAVHYYDEDDLKVEKVTEHVEVATPAAKEEVKKTAVPTPKPTKKKKEELLDKLQLSLFPELA